MNDAGQFKQVIIHTDGACRGNPGAGGYGVVLRHGGQSKVLSGGYRLTTNNRMEILAAVIGLESLKEPCGVALYSDSKYLVDAMKSGSAFRWRENDWRLDPRKSQKAKNHDMWQRLLQACEKHEVSFRWVKGHANIKDNERCDELSVQATNQQDELAIDTVYEQDNPSLQPKPSVNHAASANTTGSDVKMSREGQPCRKCGEPLIKRRPRRRHKPGQSYYFEYYLYCPKCRTMYMVKEAKRYV